MRKRNWLVVKSWCGRRKKEWWSLLEIINGFNFSLYFHLASHCLSSISFVVELFFMWWNERIMHYDTQMKLISSCKSELMSSIVEIKLFICHMLVVAHFVHNLILRVVFLQVITFIIVSLLRRKCYC